MDAKTQRETVEAVLNDLISPPDEFGPDDGRQSRAVIQLGQILVDHERRIEKLEGQLREAKERRVSANDPT